MRTLAITLLLLCLSPNLWGVDSMGYWGLVSYELSIEDEMIACNGVSPNVDATLDSVAFYLSITDDSHDVRVSIYRVPAEDTVFVDSSTERRLGVDTAWFMFILEENATIYADSSYMIVAWAQVGDGDAKVWYQIADDVSWARDWARDYDLQWPNPKWTTIDHVTAYSVRAKAYYTATAAATGQVIIIQQ